MIISVTSSVLNQSIVNSAPSIPINCFTRSIAPNSIALSNTLTIDAKSSYNASTPRSLKSRSGPNDPFSNIGYTYAATNASDNALIPCDSNTMFKMLITDLAFSSVMNELMSKPFINSSTAESESKSLFARTISNSSNNCLNNSNSCSPFTPCNSSSVTSSLISKASSAANIISANLWSINSKLNNSSNTLLNASDAPSNDTSPVLI